MWNIVFNIHCTITISRTWIEKWRNKAKSNWKHQLILKKNSVFLEENPGSLKTLTFHPTLYKSFFWHHHCYDLCAGISLMPLQSWGVGFLGVTESRICDWSMVQCWNYGWECYTCPRLVTSIQYKKRRKFVPVRTGLSVTWERLGLSTTNNGHSTASNS